MDFKLESWEKSLKDKNIILAGASTGLGRQLAQYLQSLGVNLAIFSSKLKDSGILDVLRSENMIFNNVDIRNYKEVDEFIKFAKKKFNRIDGLINCAGIYGPMGTLESIKNKEFVDAININLLGTFNVFQSSISIFKSQNYGRIVQLSGGGATSPMPKIYGYAASKAAVARFVESVALEIKSEDILINSVAPGALNTQMLDQVLAAGPEKVGDNFYKKAIKQKNEGGASLENASRCIAYLVSSENKSISSKLISAVWDPWEDWAKGELPTPKRDSSIFTLRRQIE